MSEEAAQSRPGPSSSIEICSEEPFVQEYLRLLDEGWEPDLEEYVRRVPEPWQEKTFEALDRALEARSYEPEPEPPIQVCQAE